MWNCTVIENCLNHQIDKMMFDFGNGILLVTDCETKITTRYHGKITVREYIDCFTFNDVNSLVKSLSEEIIKKKMV